MSGAPKVFISYRWTTPDHEEWVLAFATRLRADGVDVILDKWSLRGGQDTLSFMESMVNDESVKKVLMICDRGYVERANQRKGGVGTEAQIISAKVYDSTDQTKFGAIVRELDGEGSPYLPNYFSTRLFFDLSSDRALASNYEEVVRWCFDRPFHITPPIGKPPEYLSEEYKPSALNVPRSGSLGAPKIRDGDVKRSLRQIAKQIASVSLDLEGSDTPDDIIVAEIERSGAFRESCYSEMRHLLSSEQSKESQVEELHKFFEVAASSREAFQPGPHSQFQKDFQEFLVHDLFLSAVVICVEETKFDVLDEVLSRPFVRQKHPEQLGEAYTYKEFSTYIKSLNEFRKRRLNLKRISVHADKIKECHEASSIPFISIMEADFILYIREVMGTSPQDEYRRWFPTSLVFAVRRYGAFPSFLRAASKTYYGRLSKLWGGISADDFREKVASEPSGGRRALHWDYDYLDITTLANIDKIATM